MSSRIVITNQNEAYVSVSCEESISRELRDFFTFTVPGAQFSPKYKAKLWDGKIRLLDYYGRIYRGLAPYILDWANTQGYTCEYDEVDEEFSVAEALEFIKTLNLPSHIEPRDYQVKAFVKAIRKRRLLLLSPTASGKSLIIYLVLRYLHETNRSRRTLLVVPTTSLVSQLASDFRDYGYDSDSLVHRICEGQTKETSKPVVIATWQGIFKQPKKWFEQFDALFGDEAHQFKAKSLVHIATSAIHARYRLGTTGTLDGTQTHKLVLEGLFGPVYKVTTTKELMDEGHVANFVIKALLLKHESGACLAAKKFSYAQEMHYLCYNVARNRFISNLAISLSEGNTLVLFQFIEHGELLKEMIEEGTSDDRKVFFVCGKNTADDREEIRSIVEKEKNSIIVASYGVFSTGVNIKNLHNVIFASPSKSRIRNLQSIGRALRTSASKTKAVLYDIADDLRHKVKENYTLKHFLQRLKIYTEEKFKFKIYKIELKG